MSGGRDLAATRLLADVGRLLEGGPQGGRGEPRSAEERLIALAGRLEGVFGDAVVVSLIGPDGRARRLAVAHADPDVERALLRVAPTGIPPALTAQLERGDPVLVPITPALNRQAARDEPDARNRDAVGARAAFLVPMLVDAELAGVLGFLHLDGGIADDHYDDLDRAVAGEIGRRAALMLGSERRREQERQLRGVAGDLATAHGATDAARLLVHRMAEALGADAGSVFLRVPGRRELRMVHGEGYSATLLTSFSQVRFDDPVPLGLAARTGEPVWIGDRAEWERRWPALLPHAVAAGRHAAATIPLRSGPLRSGGALVGLIGLSFATPRAFGAAERRFTMELVDRAAPALERAATADERRRIADTLQRSLLPRELPVLDGLAIAARYRPGARGTQAGGDWYDVVPLDDDRVALVVGDVVGQGAGAAAVMGQLRSALAAYLLEGHGPARALHLLDRFAARVPQSLGSTVVCVVVDPHRGEVHWARAGHPYPLLTGADGARYLDGDVGGTVLGVRSRGAVAPFATRTDRIGPGTTVVLYTDGLVERRDRVVDEGFDRVRSAAADGHALDPDALADALLGPDDPARASLDGAREGALDDVALLVVRLLPAPLELEFRADGARLRGVRHRIDAWAGLAGLDPDTAYDLQLAAGEAMANAVEHAYAGRATGEVAVRLAARGDGGVAVAVRDAGRWLDPPADPGYRGRGLALVHTVGREVRVARGETGTSVAFVVPRVAAAPPGPPVAAPAAATRLRAETGPVTRIQVLGDLDLAGVEAVRAELLARCREARGEVEVDLRAVPYLASAGVALLREAARAARGAGRGLRVRAHPGSGVRRVLTLAGADSELGLDGR